jgi:hypothetical protein
VDNYCGWLAQSNKFKEEEEEEEEVSEWALKFFENQI